MPCLLCVITVKLSVITVQNSFALYFLALQKYWETQNNQISAGIKTVFSIMFCFSGFRQFFDWLSYCEMEINVQDICEMKSYSRWLAHHLEAII